MDFEQPRALWSKAFDDTQRAHLVHNLAVHLKNIKKKEILERQLSVFAAVDETFAKRLADALEVQPVAKLDTKKAEEAVRFKANVAAL